MTTEKILEIVEKYQREFENRSISKRRMDVSKTLGQLSSDERLAHAHYLIDGITQYAQIEGEEGKTGRHLASLQMILSFENWYTLEDLMSHNRSNES